MSGVGGIGAVAPRDLILPRRSLLKGLAGIFAVAVAPPIVRATSIMPVKPLAYPDAVEMTTWISADKIRFIENPPQIMGGYEITFRFILPDNELVRLST